MTNLCSKLKELEHILDQEQHSDVGVRHVIDQGGIQTISQILSLDNLDLDLLRRSCVLLRNIAKCSLEICEKVIAAGLIGSALEYARKIPYDTSDCILEVVQFLAVVSQCQTRELFVKGAIAFLTARLTSASMLPSTVSNVAVEILEIMTYDIEAAMHMRDLCTAQALAQIFCRYMDRNHLISNLTLGKIAKVIFNISRGHARIVNELCNMNVVERTLDVLSSSSSQQVGFGELIQELTARDLPGLFELLLTEQANGWQNVTSGAVSAGAIRRAVCIIAHITLTDRGCTSLQQIQPQCLHLLLHMAQANDLEIKGWSFVAMARFARSEDLAVKLAERGALYIAKECITATNDPHPNAMIQKCLGAALQLLTALSQHFRVQGQDRLWMDVFEVLSTMLSAISNVNVICEILNFLTAAVQRDERLCGKRLIQMIKSALRMSEQRSQIVERALSVMHAALDEFGNLDRLSQQELRNALHSTDLARLLAQCLFENRQSRLVIEQFGDVCAKLVDECDTLTLEFIKPMYISLHSIVIEPTIDPELLRSVRHSQNVLIGCLDRSDREALLTMQFQPLQDVFKMPVTTPRSPDPEHQNNSGQISHKATPEPGIELHEATGDISDEADWQQAESENGRIYFYDKKSGRTTWTAPDEWIRKASSGLDKSHFKEVFITTREAGEWVERVDLRSRYIFYGNKLTGQTQWRRPSVLPVWNALEQASPTAVDISTAGEPATSKSDEIVSPERLEAVKTKARRARVGFVHPTPLVDVKHRTGTNDAASSNEIAITTQTTNIPIITARVESGTDAAIIEAVDLNRPIDLTVPTDAAVVDEPQQSPPPLPTLTCDKLTTGLSRWMEKLAQDHLSIDDINNAVDEMRQLQISLEHHQFPHNDLIVKLLKVLQATMRKFDDYQRPIVIENPRENAPLIEELLSTMTLLKGMLITLMPRQLAELQKVIDVIQKDRDKCTSLFKEAHLTIKRVVVQLGGEQLPNTHWTMNEKRLVKIREFHKLELLKQLRVLTVCFDNMTQLQRASLATATEIVKNRDWLVKIARICIIVENDTVIRRAEATRNMNPLRHMTKRQEISETLPTTPSSEWNNNIEYSWPGKESPY